MSWCDESDIVYAATAGKARYQAFLNIQDCFPDITIMQISVKRAAYADKILPDEHWIVADLTPEQRHMVTHAFGQDRHGNGYRDHYCTTPSDLNALKLSWELGIFSGPFGEKAHGETPGWVGAFFYLTEFGKHVAASMLPVYAQ